MFSAETDACETRRDYCHAGHPPEQGPGSPPGGKSGAESETGPAQALDGLHSYKLRGYAYKVEKECQNDHCWLNNEQGPNGKSHVFAEGEELRVRTPYSILSYII